MLFTVSIAHEAAHELDQRHFTAEVQGHCTRRQVPTLCPVLVRAAPPYLTMRRPFPVSGSAGFTGASPLLYPCLPSHPCRSVAAGGQNTVGARFGTSRYEKPLQHYCETDNYDIINLSFLHIFFDQNAGTGPNGVTLPNINHAFHCETTFPGTALLRCPEIGTGISACQARGKKVLLSLGGAAGLYGESHVTLLLLQLQQLQQLPQDRAALTASCSCWKHAACSTGCSAGMHTLYRVAKHAPLQLAQPPVRHGP